MSSTPGSPRSRTPVPGGMATPSPRSQSVATGPLPDRTVPEPTSQPESDGVKTTSAAPGTASSSTFVPAWRRPTLAETGDRRPSVQFVPPPSSRSSSAKAPASRAGVAVADGAAKPPSTGRRLSSPPPPAQFRPSVSFDTFRNPSASDFSLTLHKKHKDYEYTKRSRTFLCGTDTHDYSDTALEWLIDELVDDGDEVVCLRVVEPDSREAVKWARGQGEKGYKIEAERFLDEIVKKNTDDRAISLVLEFSIGKVQETIQQMIRIYEPAMLVVGTRGRSLTGYQGLLSSGSVSKYCLQYSPVPVIVVRPSSKREAKKRKRLQDPTRTGYRDILDRSEDAPRGRGGHLLDPQNRQSVIGADYGALGELGSGDPEEEARRVAEAIGYRKGQNTLDPRPGMGRRQSSRDNSLSRVTSTSSVRSDDGDGISSPHLHERLLKSPDLRHLDSPAGSDLDSDDDEFNPLDASLDDENLRPEDEAAILAWERAQKVVEEEKEEALARERERSRGGRSRSRGRARGDDNEEGAGAAVLGLLGQLDRGMK